MVSIMAILFVPIVLFLVVVMPTWLTLHYKHKERSQNGLSDEERKNIDELLGLGDKLAERIKTLEAILDTEHPDWREKQ